MRYARGEKGTRNSNPKLRAQARMLEGITITKDGKINVRNLLTVAKSINGEAGKTARNMIIDAGKDESTREYVIKELVEALGAGRRSVEAANILGKIKAVEAIGALRETAGDNNTWRSSLQCAAIWALGELKAKEAIPEIIEGLSDPSFMSVPPDALLKIGEESIPALIEALSERDSLKRRGAAETLGQFGSDAKEALPALKKLTGFWTRIADKELFNAAEHAINRIEHSGSE